jgi:homoserine kinase type II
MAVYTQVSGEQMMLFIARYDVGALVSFHGIAEGVENTNYLLHTEKGEFILTLYEKRVNSGDLPFFLGLMEHLQGRGLLCPTPLHDKNGDVLQELAGRQAALISFLEGYSVLRPSAKHCGHVGRAMAAMHVAGDGFSLRRANALSVKGWRSLADATASRADTVALGLGNAIAEELAFLEQNWPEGLPAGIIHADLFPDNVFFLGDELSGVIDFYFACNDMLAYDIAICLNAWCFEEPNAFNVTKARALLRGYGEKRPLNADELAALPILARGAALRFLLTRLYDWFHTCGSALVRPKDPSEYWRKLRFHQRVNSVKDYGL